MTADELTACGASSDLELLRGAPRGPQSLLFRRPGMGDDKASECVQIWHTFTLRSGGNLLDDTIMRYGRTPPEGTSGKGCTLMINSLWGVIR